MDKLENDTNMKCFLVKKKLLNLVFQWIRIQKPAKFDTKDLIFAIFRGQSNQIHMKKYCYPMKLLIKIYFQLSSLQLHN